MPSLKQLDCKREQFFTKFIDEKSTLGKAEVVVEVVVVVVVVEVEEVQVEVRTSRSRSSSKNIYHTMRRGPYHQGDHERATRTQIYMTYLASWDILTC